MKKHLLIVQILLLLSYCSFSQGVGIGPGDPDSSAVLDIKATNKGLLIPRMSTASINAIVNPAKGLMVYDSTLNLLKINMGTPAAPNFQAAASSNTAWNLNGNTGINPNTQFLGTIDIQPLNFRINNARVGELSPVTGNIFLGLGAGKPGAISNTTIAIGVNALRSNNDRSFLVAIGDSALLASTTGLNNTAIGSKSLRLNTNGSDNTATGFNSLFSNISGSGNTANGASALFNNTGSSNTAVGHQSLFANTSGGSNTAVGAQALAANTTAGFNTAVGRSSLSANTTGDDNTATGASSLERNTTGRSNSAFGSFALFVNSIGEKNTGIGDLALELNTTGSNNTAVGASSLISNRGGNDNIAIGVEAMRNNVNGSTNIAIGNIALDETTNSNNNVVIGFNAAGNVDLGFNNTFVGAGTDVNSTGTFNTVLLGNNARGTASNQVRLGNTFTTSIGGFVGYSNLSDGRFKRNVKETVQGLDFIMKLRPVMYQFDIGSLDLKLNPNSKTAETFKNALNENEKTMFSGFVAQEVEQAAKSIGYDFSGIDKPKNENDLYGLRYSEFVVPLVKAMQEQQQMIEELKRQNADLQKRILALEKK
jgi:trimeric autotransporter adhesin